MSAVAIGVLCALALAGELSPIPAIAGLVVVAVAAMLALRSSRAPATAVESIAGSAGPSQQAISAPAPLSDALEALSDPLLLISAQEPDDLIARRVVFANRSARELLRIPSEGALLVTVLRHPEVLETVDESLFGGVVAETVYETSGAQARCWRAWSAPLPAGDDGRSRAVLLLRDETDARRNARMSADFLANASHELRTPLASLTGFIETLRGHAREDETARERFLGIMAVQAERMARLIDDLLSLSRIEMNEHVPPSGATDVASVVRDVSEALTPQARAKSLTITVEAPARAVIEGERDQIIQVVQNLVDNAVKYTPDRGVVTVKVESGLTAETAARGGRTGAAKLSLLTPDRADHRYTVIRVSDQGPGIAREHLPRLTERFYRVEGQKSGERMGTGLGLAIVKHVVNRHRGGLLVESVQGAGATFSVYLPEPAALRAIETTPQAA